MNGKDGDETIAEAHLSRSRTPPWASLGGETPHHLGDGR
jgi:hypothetical protein